MPFERINGVRLRYELRGSGARSLVLVHGSWGSHLQWELVAPAFAESFRVLSYDRRGHSESETPPGQGSVRDDVSDLAALIEHFDLAPAWVAGNSFGASIALRLAGARPDLLRGVLAHEPPLFSVVAGDPEAASALEETMRAFPVVLQRIEAGDHAEAADRFFAMALEPGAWEGLPAEIRRGLIDNAPTFLDEGRDPDALAFDLEWIRSFPRPIMLSVGERSPASYAPVVRKLAAAQPRAVVLTLPDTGHVPHVTHPEAYVKAASAFISESED